MKRSDLIHAVLNRTRDVILREKIGCEARGAECAAPGEYILTAYGLPAEVVRLAGALSREGDLHGADLVEDVGEMTLRLQQHAADAERPRHLHIALLVPSAW